MIGRMRGERCREASGMAVAVGVGVAWALIAPARAATAAQDASALVKPFRYDAKSHRDPFVPLVRDGKLVTTVGGEGRETGKPMLYGILWDPGGASIALINDTEAKVGSSIDGYLVKEIRKDAVVLTREGEGPVMLQLLFEGPPSKPSSSTPTGRRKP